MFVIYHVPGKKVGCTSNFPQRCYDQGLVDGEFEILGLIPQECGEQFAGDIEHGLASRFGYPKYEHYARGMEKRRKGGRIGGKIGGKIGGARQAAEGRTPFFDPEVQRRGGAACAAVRRARGDDIAKGLRSGEAGKRGQATQLAAGIHISQRIKANPPVCPRCGRVGKSVGIFHHMKVCARKHADLIKELGVPPPLTVTGA